MSEQVTSNHVNQGERVRLMCVGVLAGAIAGLVTGIEARIKMRIIALATGSVPGLSLATLVILLPSQTAYVPYILMSIFLIILGMSDLGHRHVAWKAIERLAAGFTLIPAAIYSINQYIHFILLGLWGIPWLLICYVVFTNSAKQQQTQHNVAPGTTIYP